MTCGTNGAERNAYRILVGNPAGKRPLRRPRHRWVDNIKIDREIRWNGMDWIDLAQDRDGNEPSGSINVGKFLSSSKVGSFSRRAQLRQ
jgi:hypothetical protein